MRPEALIKKRPDFIEYYDYTPMAPLYFKGRHYLISPNFKTYRIDGQEITDIGVDSELLMSRFGPTNTLVFNGLWSVASVFDKYFFVCSTKKYINYCFYFDPEENRQKKTVLKARGRFRNDQYYFNRRHMFEADGELHVVAVNSHNAHNINIQTLKNINDDWSEMIYEDPQWERDFRNDTFSERYSTYYTLEQETLVPYDTLLQDFYPIPGTDFGTNLFLRHKFVL